MTFTRLTLLFTLSLTVACGDDAAPADAGGNDTGSPDTGGTDAGPVEDSGGTDAAGIDSSPTNDAGTVLSGDCTTAADCEGRECIEITPGGWRVCAEEIVNVSDCSGAGVGVDECGCEDAPVCEGGVPCVRGPLTLFCGGALPQQTNVCAFDQCEDDATCGEGALCLAAPSLGRQVRSCVQAPCRTAADCTDSPGGVCAPVADPCCGVRNLTCVYPNNPDACFDSGVCGDGMVCVGGVCGDQPPCPG